jgi:membrane fusion protein, multidrug efflux system
MSTDTIQRSSEPNPIDASVAARAPEVNSQSDSASKPIAQRRGLRRKLLIGVGVLAFVIALIFGIPWVRFVLSTVSTDDAFVNGHVTFVASRVHGQVSRVLVDDNNRVRKGELLV